MKKTIVVSLIVIMLATLVGMCVAATSNTYDPAVRVIVTADIRQPTHRDSYAAGHIPGAIYLNLKTELSDLQSDVPSMILPSDGFENLMGSLGINSGTTVVVYDDTGGLWAARLWWALKYYGHEAVKILNGGLAKWTVEDRPLETAEITPAPTTFKADHKRTS